MSDAVFLGRNGQQLGPYSQAQLAAMAGRAEIHAGDLAWYEGMAGWLPVADVLAALGIAVTIAPPLPAAQVPIARGGAPAAAPMTKKDMYEAFIGPEKAGYYVPIFEGFDQGGGAVSWNTPAALITQWWMLYRGMFLWGFLWYPILSSVVSLTVTMACSAISPALGGLGPWLVILGSVVVMGLYSNKIYHGHVNKLIERSGRLGLSEQLRREWLIRKGATNFIWVFFVLIIGVAMIGILAAIAIPAYQDYVIRAQVSEGAILADGAKTAVLDYQRQHNALPASNADAGLEAPDRIKGKYVQQVEVHDGAVTVTYGGEANRLIQGSVLAYVPEETGGGGNLVWHCNGEQTTIKNKYRPQLCRN